MARASLRAILYAGGAAAILIAMLHLVFGVASIPGAGPVNATGDSEDRFYAVIFAGYGIALVHGAGSVIARGPLITFLTGLFLAGAFARVLSWVLMGPPHPFFVAMLILELGLPFVVWSLQWKIAQAPQATRKVARE